MGEIQFEDPPSQLRVLVTLLGCMLIAAFLQIVAEECTNNFVFRALNDTQLSISLVKLLVGGLLSIFAFRASGLRIGDKSGWKKRWLLVVFFFLMPLIVTVIVYPYFSGRPFRGMSIAFWLIAPIAEELLFSGFIFGQMEKIFGKAPLGWGGALSAAPMITAFLFALYFWPFLRNEDAAGKLGASYAKTQMFYAVIYSAWILNMRRWTGSVWPCVLNHIVLNVMMVVL